MSRSRRFVDQRPVVVSIAAVLFLSFVGSKNRLDFRNAETVDRPTTTRTNNDQESFHTQSYKKSDFIAALEAGESWKNILGDGKSSALPNTKDETTVDSTNSSLNVTDAEAKHPRPSIPSSLPSQSPTVLRTTQLPTSQPDVPSELLPKLPESPAFNFTAPKFNGCELFQNSTGEANLTHYATTHPLDNLIEILQAGKLLFNPNPGYKQKAICKFKKDGNYLHFPHS